VDYSETMLHHKRTVKAGMKRKDEGGGMRDEGRLLKLSSSFFIPHPSALIPAFIGCRAAEGKD
jgi:hypothetical protein